MKIYTSIDELIGNTPLFEIKKIEEKLGLKARVLVKLERFNPAGSVKDRVALSMLNEAEKSGKISKGATIIEPTSGNTGIGLSAIGASRGYKVVLTMPDTMSIERIKLLKAYGATVVLTDGAKGMSGAIEKAYELNKNTPNSLVVGQFVNPANPLAHYEGTGREIFEDTEGKVDCFVAGIGTGGTISGTAKYLREKNEKIKIIGVEPEGSPLITKGVFGPHKIQGIGANFIPEIYDGKLVDEVYAVSDNDAFEYARILAKTEGLLVGISSGAALSVAIKLAKLDRNNGKTIVALLPDTGERYLSTELFE